MKYSIYFGAAVALGLLASPVVAQQSSPPPDSDAAAAHQDAMHHDAMTRHDMDRHDRMSMHGRMSNARMMRWCRSMSHRQMMRNPHCRSMMMGMRHHSDRMHHM
jgi:hypothetical protein